MQTKWILATVFAAATAVSAEANRPKIYYPRNVKRQYDNSNNVTDIVPAPESTSSKRQLPGGLLGDLLGGGSSTDTEPSKSRNDDGIIIGPTGIVIPGVIGGDETETSASTTAPETDAQTQTQNTRTTTKPKPTTTTTKGGGLLDPLPTLISEIVEPKPTTTQKPKPTTAPIEGGNGNSTTEDTKPTTKHTSTTKGGGLLDPLPSLITSILEPEPEPTVKPTTKPPQQTTEKPEQPAPSSTSGGGLLDPLPGIITSILPEPSDNSSNPDPQPAPSSSSGGGLLDPLPGIITSILPEPSDNSSSPDPQQPAPTSTSGGGLLDPLPTLITDLLPGPTSSPNNTDPRPTTTSNIISDILPTLFPEPTTSGMISEPIPSVSISIPVPPNPTEIPGNNTSVPEPTASPQPTDLPGNGTNVPTTPVPTMSPTDLPTENSTLPDATPTVTSDVESSINTPPPTTQQPTPTSVISEVPPTTEVETETEKPGVTSIRPTATYTNTQDWMPTTIVADPTTFTYVPPTSQPTGTSSEALPTEIPKVILPDDPNKPAPEGTVPIQIGFLFPLNYEFVAKNTVAAAQIFKYLPQALSTAGGFSQDQVVVTKLVPYDTRGKWGYVTTLAKLYYPEALLDTLQMDLWAPNSKIYNSGNAIAEDLTAVINPKIDIFGNIEEEGPNKGGKDDDDSSGGGGDAFDSGSSGSSSSQKATTAGIAVGAIGLSAMYGAAMFIVARRYKRKRQAHRRASSISGSDASSDMQYAPNGSPALMGGALLSQDYSNYGAATRESQGSGRTGGNGSARTANISAPVATENSLGWN